MTIKMILAVLFCLPAFHSMAQSGTYTTQNAHSHNDYEQKVPFRAAYDAGFASIEADIFLVHPDSPLYVAHTTQELTTRKRRLDSMYLLPLVELVRKNKGSIFADRKKKLQILVDIKTTPAATLKKLVETIGRYPELTGTPSLTFAISGNRPSPDSFAYYPSYIVFDGEFSRTYSNKAMEKVVLMSADLRIYTQWNGTGSIPPADSVKLYHAIHAAHAMKKPVRFWNAPDQANAWQQLMQAGVDLINTDKISELSAFLEKRPVHE